MIAIINLEIGDPGKGRFLRIVARNWKWPETSVLQFARSAFYMLPKPLIRLGLGHAKHSLMVGVKGAPVANMLCCFTIGENRL